jgi:hypothetical protein
LNHYIPQQGRKRKLLDVNACSKVLSLTADILEEMGVSYWLDSGTLLSAYRDRAINLFDHDIDVRVYVDELTGDTQAEFVKKLWQAGFRLVVADKPIEAQIGAGHPLGTGINLDLKLCFKDDEHVWYYCWKEPDPRPIVHIYPIKFFKNMGRIELLGREYPCPQPIVEYLEWHYGKDWREFKVREDQMEESDITWDYMKDPPCAMSLTQFYVFKKIPVFTPF